MVLTVFLGGSKIALKNDYVSPQTVLTATSLVNDSNSSRNGKLFDTGIIPPVSLKPITVDIIDIIKYFCSIHSWMQGTLNIVQSS
jgi:hypothetical protein